ncbi:uncharacterized protein BYT42DRAFT_6636 [Radiomyces spectabilis]|uniref:uncharacterized protein n=1 Tax=Radiomyces spectabilis TaxID=64574 RepID=UPI00221FA84D|nr:uncharacterized protein BYT42DRAFT_6636 [Radiomyces spectabilis]KAI8393446.1 hypothetical protein BYT42DRAFT_6636 [Radiomyces spectabilis]
MASKRSSLGLHLLSSQKRQELKEMFTSFDKNGDGKLSPSELEKMLQFTGIQTNDVPSMLKNVHTDSEGNLSFEEFAKLMRPTLSDPIRLSAKQLELKEAFDAFDRDGDGVINAAELKLMMQELGDRITQEEAEQLIHDADKNHDGVVNFEEFSQMMGVRPPTTPIEKKQDRCEHHHHHRYSFRRFFCSHK